jgi:WD40 repeat protein
MHRITLLLILALILAACTPTDMLPPTLTPDERPTPTAVPLTVQGWIAAAERITTQNAPRLRPLGELRTIEPFSTLFAYAISPDGTRLAALNLDFLTVWDLIDGSTVFTLERLGATQVYYAPDKSTLYLLAPDGTVRVLDAETGNQRDSFRAHPDFSGAVAYAADAGLLALGGNDGTLKVWDVVERRSLVTFGEGAVIGALALSPDGETLLSASEDGNAALWRWREQTSIAVTTIPLKPFTAVFSDDGRYAAMSAGGVVVWDTLTGEARTLPSEHGGLLMRFVHNQPYLLLDTAAALEIWNLQTNTRAAVLTDLPGAVSADTSPDGGLMFGLVRNSESGASLWSLANLARGSVARGSLSIDTPTLFSVLWSADGFSVLVFDVRGFVTVWGVAD